MQGKQGLGDLGSLPGRRQEAFGPGMASKNRVKPPALLFVLAVQREAPWGNLRVP